MTKPFWKEHWVLINPKLTEKHTIFHNPMMMGTKLSLNKYFEASG
jgi:hypothetical protein